MKSVSGDLERRIPDLIDIWRRSNGKKNPGMPGGKLTIEELHEAAGKIRLLSRGLTRGRDLAGERYFDSEEFLLSYLLYYWPISYVQGRILLREAGHPAASALDLGAGPGPLSLALLDHGVRRVVACDRNARGLALARRLAGKAGCLLETAPWDGSSGEPPEGTFDLATLGHVLNELWTGSPDRIERRFALLEEIARRLSPGGRLLIIEPALRETTQDLLRLRDRLVDAGYRIKSPCVFQGHCPALPDSTCHGEFDWPLPGMVRDIARRSRISAGEHLRMSYLIAELPGKAPFDAAFSLDEGENGGPYRVVSERMLSKSGRFRYFVCGTLGRFTLSAKREGASPGIGIFFSLNRGDLIRFSGTEKRENGLGLTAESRITVVRRRPSPKG